ncbi:MAG: hypothetical protein RR382_02960 [Tannerellaceae bacterium]
MATIGLRDVHYAIITNDDATGTTYETPVRIAGAISANVNPNTASATLFADDGPYDSATTLGEIELELNMADVPPSVSAVMLGHTYSNGLLVKKSSDTPPYLAIGYRSLKSNGAYRHTWLYKGKFTDGEQNNSTKGDDIEYQTPTLKGAFVKRAFDDAWQMEADSDDVNISGSVITDWFTAVVAPSAASKTLSSIAITTPPTKTAYTAAQVFAPAGMVVTATYSDGSTTVVTPNCTYSPATGLTAGTTKVTIAFAFGGVTKTVEQTITVT